MNTIWIVLPILTLLMFDLGLSLRLEDFSQVIRRPWPMIVALFGQLVLLPAIAIASSPFIFASEVMAIPAILYSLMMNIVLLTYVFVVRKRDTLQ